MSRISSVSMESFMAAIRMMMFVACASFLLVWVNSADSSRLSSMVVRTRAGGCSKIALQRPSVVRLRDSVQLPSTLAVQQQKFQLIPRGII